MNQRSKQAKRGAQILGTIGLLLLSAGTVFAAVSQYASLNNGEWSREIGIIDESPTYDETDPEDYSCGTRSQTHEYYLDSINTRSRDYWTTIHAFAIVLEVDYDSNDNPATDDFLTNVDTENLLCTVGGSTYVSCGFDVEDDLGEVIASSSEWNGTTVTYQTLDFLPGNPRGLLWEYSSDDPGNIYETPWLEGRSSSSAASDMFNESISFGLVSYDEEYTATTTSYTLVEHMYINPTTGDYGDLNDWTHVYTAEADPDGDGDSDADPDGDYIYWHGMNAVLRSIFADCENACADLTLTSPTTLTAEDADSITTLQIEAEDEEGDTWDGTYEYSSDGTCEFTTSWLSALVGGGSATLETAAETVYVHSCTAGDTISIEEIDYPVACQDEISFEDACSALSITSPTEITVEDFEGTNVRIDISATAASGGTWNGEYEYSSDNSSAYFSRYSSVALAWTSRGNPYTTSQETVYYYNGEPGDTITVEEVDYPSACFDSLTAEEEEPYCGDGILDPDGADNTTGTADDEACDDGNTTDGDGCDSTCQPEEETPYCSVLSVTPSLIEYDAIDDVTTLTLTDLDQNGDAWAGTYTLSSTGTCEFSTSSIMAALRIGSNPLTTTASTVYAFDCSEGDTISITETTYSVCSATIPVESETGEYCGDGVLDTDGADNTTGTADDEQCDDGNTTNGDGCSSTCQTESTSPYCGDGVLDTDGADNTTGTADDEQCDDGNTTSGDGCSSTCQTESTSACISLSLSPETTEASGVTQVAYTITPNPTSWPGPYTWTSTNASGIFNADSGATQGNPITTADLSVEYTGLQGDTITVTEATGYGTVCYDTAGITGTTGGGSYCGDGTVDAGEQCDDGNNTDGDGCESNCTTITSSGGCTTNCSSGGGSTYCGDGDIQSPNSYGTYEECDDGNSENNDGCSNVCQIDEVIEETTYCGDGEVQFPNDDGEYEECDDGNSDDTDSCLSTCETPDAATPEDEVAKYVYTYNFGWFSVDNSAINGNGFGDTTYGHDYDYAFYTIAYTPDPNEVATEVTITDTIAEGIPGTDEDGTALGAITYYTASSSDFEQVRCWVDGDTETFENCGYEGSYRGFSVKYEDGNNIEACDTEVGTAEDGTVLTVEDSGETCYEGDISDTAGITLKNLEEAATDADGAFLQIAIRYLGQVDNGNFDCTTTTATCPVLGFVNEVEVDDGRLSDEVDVSIICPYLLTRNAGDVYLEEDLEAGYDLSCYYDRNNSDGLVFRLVDSWQNSACTSEGSTDVVDRLSSYICEILTDVETVSEWSVSAIKEIQEKQISSISRYNDNLSSLASGGSYTLSDFNDLSSDFGVFLSNEKQNVYKISGSDLRIDLHAPILDEYGNITGYHNNTVPAGAHTIIVEGGDLYIDSDVEYDPAFDLSTVTDLSEIPSIAFVVLGGDVYISNSVSQMVGVYYVEAQNGIGGTLTGDWTDPFTPLEIHGSVYGDIDPLLEQRTFSGPANYDHGNVVIRYDERILLNTPPGLEEFVDIESERTVR